MPVTQSEHGRRGKLSVPERPEQTGAHGFDLGQALGDHVLSVWCIGVRSQVQQLHRGMITEMNEKNAARPVRVWDLPTRFFHWSLVVLLVVAWSTAQAGLEWMTYHLWAGYSILALLLFRLMWGFLGAPTAQFGSFIARPGVAWRYARELAAGRHAVYVGHNPLGGYMVFLLLLLVLIQVVTGLFSTDDILVSGPLADRVPRQYSRWATGVHKVNINILIAAVAVHVGAIGFYRWRFGDNLVLPMVTGKKLLSDEVAPHQGEASPWRAAGLLLISVVAVYLVVSCL
ncbi:hypothetical protein E4680_11170 [Candidatus Macondimonas diazotrophica]|uniref:Cytochrome b561 bacterial/Ni-hydrogenase domain-containing protein n=2 Tax=Candidatus Macondimonas diazotrophica TaxID=2305248 RepID=A0A4Z0F666_9GAMM|nr:hypothetical protein E4680_11170 [Candidatus Macondimonas diazotrophica]HBG51658.1 hypothetical protein [Gammaproteobacteria bacterium]